MMGIYERIETNKMEIESVYDLAAICYDYMREQIGHQALFLAEYIEHSDVAEKNNPNIRMLKQFGYESYLLMLQKDRMYSFNEIVGKILENIASVEERLKPYGTEVYNEATIAYYLLQAVDLYAENMPESSADAPLNEKYREKSYIYRGNGSSILTSAAKELRFRDKIQLTKIRNEFKYLRILEKDELDSGMNPPKMVTLHIGESDLNRRLIMQGKKLKVVVIPFGKDALVDFKKVQGSSFHVEYIEECKQAAIEKALHMLDAAIRKRANIIIFPEYVCFPEMQDRIGHHLKAMYHKTPKKVESLFLVVAGSGWTEDDNNVSRIYSYNGKLLGEQYKYSPYDGIDENGDRWIEGLRNPGKHSVIVTIPNIGNVMPAICRDVSNRDKTEEMANIFIIDFIVAVACSKSLHGGFERQLANITETNMLTCSLVCNCCKAAASQGSCERGIVVTPRKKGSVIEAKIRSIRSKKEQCENCTGCTFSMTLSFETQDIEKGKIVGRITQKSV